VSAARACEGPCLTVADEAVIEAGYGKRSDLEETALAYVYRDYWGGGDEEEPEFDPDSGPRIDEPEGVA
jgi:hypothetical protein